MSKDSTVKTLVVALGLCVVCSILVSTAAVKLRALQVENKALDVKKNLLVAAKLVEATATKEEINKAFTAVETKLIDLSTGEVAEGIDPSSYDTRKAAKDPSLSMILDPSDDIARIKSIAKVRPVYLVKKGDQVDQIVIPFHGKGLWSTMYGFLCLDSDTRTVRGIAYYEHGETPGLGGEVDNVRWKKSWVGKNVLTEDSFEPMFEVVKGSVNPSNEKANYQVDGLSGATLTSDGVEYMINFWLGKMGYGKYLANFRSTKNGGGNS